MLATLATSSCEKHIRDPLHCLRLNILHRWCNCCSIVAGRFQTCSSRCSLFLSLSHRENYPRNVQSTLWGFQQQPEALRWESRKAESQCLLFTRTLALLVRLWENYNEQMNCFFSAAGQKWLPSIHSLPRPCAPLCLILLSRVKRRRKKRTVVVRRGGRWGEREKARDWVGELVQYFDNGYLWKKPTRSPGHGGGACRGGHVGRKRRQSIQSRRMCIQAFPQSKLKPIEPNVCYAKTILRETYSPLSLLNA